MLKQQMDNKSQHELTKMKQEAVNHRKRKTKWKETLVEKLNMTYQKNLEKAKWMPKTEKSDPDQKNLKRMQTVCVTS